MRKIRTLLFIFLTFAGIQSASAVDYYWIQSSSPTIHYSTAVIGCQSIMTASNWDIYDQTVVASDFAKAACWGHSPNTSTSTVRYTLYRSGTGCTLPSTVDSTGSCSVPASKCPTAGTSAGSVTVTTAWATGPSTTSPIAKKVVADNAWIGSLFAKDSCEIKITGAPTSCYISSVPTTGGYYRISCSGEAQYTGIDALTTEIASDSASTVPSVSTTGKDACPTGTIAVGYDSAGTKMCSGSSTATTDTTATKTTTGTTTTANSDGSTTTTSSSGVTNSDGSTTTKTTTCTTQTSGSSSCTTSTKTSTSTAGTAGVNDTDTSTGEKTDSVTAVSGDLYTAKTKTFSTVMSDFNSKVSNAPFMSAASGFFTVSVSGGSCPTWTASVPYLKTTVDLGQYFCSSNVETMMSYIGIGVMIAAAYVAFKIAFL